MAGRDLLAAGLDGRAGTGNEVLHLLGNAVFLAGLGAALGLARRRALRSADRWWLAAAFAAQAAHVVEHVALTATWAVLGEAQGATTAFGLLDPATPVAASVRVWAHFGLNTVATFLAAVGLAGLRPRCDDPTPAVTPPAWRNRHDGGRGDGLQRAGHDQGARVAQLVRDGRDG